MNEAQQATAEALERAGYAPDFASRVATRIDGAEHERLQKLKPEQLRQEIDQAERDRFEARGVLARALAITTGRAQEHVEQLTAGEVAALLTARGREAVKSIMNAAYDRRMVAVQHAPPEPKPKPKKTGKRQAAPDPDPDPPKAEDTPAPAPAKPKTPRKSRKKKE